MKYKSFFAFLGLLILVLALSRCGIYGAETEKPKPAQSTGLPFYPANNYIGTAIVAEDDTYIVYRNINKDFTGTYLYTKKGQTTTKISDEAATDFFLRDDVLFYTSGKTLMSRDLNDKTQHEVATGLTAMTGYEGKIYYANEQGELYELDTATEQGRLLTDAATLMPQSETTGVIDNLSLGDGLYFTLSTAAGGTQGPSVFIVQANGSVKKIKEFGAGIENVVYDGGYLYYTNDAGYNRMKADGSGEELLLAQGQDGNAYQQFFVYDGIWYYQKTTPEGKRYLCCQGALSRLKVGKLPQEGNEKMLVDLNKGDLSDIVNMNQTEKYLMIETKNPTSEGESLYYTWAINRKLAKASFVSEVFPL